MRLIDADKFKEDLMKLWDYSCVDGITATTVLKQVIHDLDNAPTIDVDGFRVTTDDIIHWCATHPNPEIKKQYEEELSRAKKLICATCKYNGLEGLGMDSPCAGCTTLDNKMYEPKEEEE